MDRQFLIRGGGKVHFSDGAVPFFRVSFSPIFCGTGYLRKAIFVEPGKKIFVGSSPYKFRSSTPPRFLILAVEPMVL